VHKQRISHVSIECVNGLTLLLLVSIDDNSVTTRVSCLSYDNSVALSFSCLHTEKGYSEVTAE